MRAGICTECKTQMEWKKISMEFEGFGVKVKVEGIPAMVCPKCGEESIPGPEAVKLSEAVDEILKAAKKREKKRYRPEFKQKMKITEKRKPPPTIFGGLFTLRSPPQADEGRLALPR